MKLQEIIKNSRFDDVEIERISALLQSDDNLKGIIKKYSRELWISYLENYQHKLEKNKLDKKQRHRSTQVMEMDIGTNNSIPEKKHLTIVSNIARDIKDKDKKGDFYKSFYINALLKYFSEEQGLYKFLSEYDLNFDNQIPTSEIIKTLLKNDISYGYSKKKVKEMYEYLHFERLSSNDEKEIFLTNIREDKLLEIIEELKIKMNSYETQFNLLKNQKDINPSAPTERVIEIVKNNDELNPKIKGIEESIGSVSKELEAIRKSTVTAGDFRRETSRLDESLNKKISDTQDDLESAKTKLLKEISKKNDELLQEVHEKYDQAFSELNLRLVKAIEENKKGFLRINEDTKILAKVGEKHQNITKEPIFIHAWLNYLSNKYDVNLSLEEAVIYHTVFKTCNYISVHDFILPKSWIEAMGFEEETRVDSASPLWVNTLDWYGLVTHLENTSDTFKVGVLTNFDVALTESYLFPTLDKWFISGKKEMQKLFLVSSVSKEKIVQPGVYALVAKLPYGQAGEFSLINDISNMDSFQLDKAMPKVKTSVLLEWTLKSKEESFRRAIVEIPKDRDGVIVPDSCYLNFKRLYSNLCKYFSTSDSFKIAMDTIIRPYLMSSYGLEKAETTINFIYEMVENE